MGPRSTKRTRGTSRVRSTQATLIARRAWPSSDAGRRTTRDRALPFPGLDVPWAGAGLDVLAPAAAATPVPEEPYTVPFGKADVKREGRDVTIVTLGLMVHRSLEAAAELERKGVSVEVIDLRTLVPLDRDAVLASVRKTGRLLVIDEDYRSFGLSGEIAATVAEADPKMLKAPFRRLAVPDVPIPYSRPLEGFVFPNAQKIADAAAKLMA